VGQEQVIQRPVDRAEEGADVAAALGIRDLCRNRVELLVHPRVVARQRLVLIDGGHQKWNTRTALSRSPRHSSSSSTCFGWAPSMSEWRWYSTALRLASSITVASSKRSSRKRPSAR